MFMEGVTNKAFEPEEEDHTTMGQVVRLTGGKTLILLLHSFK